MKTVAYIIAGFTVYSLFACIITRQSRKDWGWKKVVHLPFGLAAIGMVCGGIFSIPMVLFAQDVKWLSVFFGVIVLGCDSLMVAYRNCVIWYDDEGFLARNFFGIKRSCSYAQVEELRTGKDIRVFFQGHSILIDEISVDGERFLDNLIKGYKRTTGKRIPSSPSFRRKWDPMNGHLDYPWAYFLFWVATGLFCAALPVFLIVVTGIQTDPSKIVVQNVQFSGYEIQGDSLMLSAEGEEQPYEICYFQDYGAELPEPEALCSGEVYCVGVEGDRRDVKSLTGSHGEQYITLEREHRVYRARQRTAALLLCVLALIGMYCSYLGIAVARHPERYSRKVQGLFYKDGVLH